jgi:hypothetical protein
MKDEDIVKIGLVAIVLVVLYVWINRCSGDKIRINTPLKKGQKV